MIGSGVLLGLAIALASLAWDPSAHAAEPKRVLALLVALVAAAFALVNASAARPRAPRALPWSWIFGLGFVGLSAVSALWGLPSGRLDLATWIGALACGAAAAHAGRGSAIRTARTAAIVAGGACSLWALGLVIAGARGFSIHAGQGNPNWLGLLLAMTIPLSIESAAIKLSRHGLRDRRALAGLVLAAVQPAALYASHSRVSWVAAALALLWLSWSVRRVPRAVRSGAVTLALAAGLTAGVLAIEHAPRHAPVAVVTSATPAPTVSEDLAPEDVAAARSLRGRFWIATHSLHAAREAAPFGVGLGRFGHAYLDAQGDALARLDVRTAARRFVNPGTAHDEVLQVAVESGPFAAVLLVAALVCALRELRRTRWHAGGAVVVAGAVAMLGDSPFRQPASCVMFVLVLACARPRLAKSRSLLHSFARGRLGALLVLASLACALFVSTRAWLSTHCRETTSVALRLDSDSGDAQLARGLEEALSGRHEEALVHLERAGHLTATVAARVAIGEAHLAGGASSEGREAFRAALAWHPGSLRARVAMAEAERRLGHLDEAERHARAAHAVSPGDPRVAELESRVGEARMDTD